MLLQIKKARETSDGDLTCYVFSFEDALAHLGVIKNPGADGILTIETLGSINMSPLRMEVLC